MSLNFLQLNTDKTEILVIGPDQVSKSISPYLRHLAGNIKPSARNLGVMFDQNLNFDHHIKSCFFNIAKISPALVQNAATRLLTNTKHREHITPIVAHLLASCTQNSVQDHPDHSQCPSWHGSLLYFWTPNPILYTKITQIFWPMLLSVSHSRLTKWDRAFIVLAATLWNCLPLIIRSAESVPQNSKAHLYRLAFLK